ncbi:MAG TPA: O-antigen ligase family protein [Patescibacteria group bacterium]|nr:O-antigen ligase family protein [Patescibacteria group bacterium]
MIEGIILAILLLLLPSQFGRHFWPSEAYLFGLKVDYLSPTLYLQDLCLLLLFLFSVKRNRKKFFSEKKHLILAGLYVLISSLNIGFSPNPQVSFFSWLRITELVFLGWFVSQNAGQVFSLLGRILPLTLVFEFFLSLRQAISQSSQGGLFWFLGERSFTIFTPGIARGSWLGKVLLRPYGTFSHPNSLAGFTLVALILIFGKRKLSLFDRLAISLGFILLLLTFSRAAWLAALILGLLFLLNQLKLGFLRKTSLRRFPFLASIFSLPLLTYFFSRTTIDSSSFLIRRELAEFSLQEMRENPLIGFGAGRFVISLSQNRPVWQWLYWLQPVHNIFLLVTAEGGFFGLALFGYWVFGGLFSLLKKTKDASTWAILLALGAILLTGLFDHYWLTLIQNQLFFAVVLGLSWGVAGKNP